jgi:hypothetical protein
MAQLIMGSENTSYRTAGLLFADGTEQDTAPVNNILNEVIIDPTPPVAGDELIATDATHASWQPPSGGGKVSQAARVAMGTIASATPSAVTTLNWVTPFADNNYTVTGSVVVAETPSDGAATAICCIGMIQLLPDGAGINFVVCNADGVPHNVTAQFYAVHD